MNMKTHLLSLSLIVIVACGTLHAQTQEQRTYDNLGRISTVTYTQGNQSLRISYDYDRRGNIVKTTSEQTTSVHEANSSMVITVSPNPTSQHILVETPAQDGELVSMVITDQAGRTISTHVSEPATNGKARLSLNLDASKLANGLYFVNATTQSGIRSCGFQLAK